MTVDEIKKNIHDKPLDRIPPELRQQIEKGMPFTDIHTHIFNYKDVPNKYLGIRMPFKPKFLGKISKILHGTVKRKDTDWLSKFAYFIDVIDDLNSDEVLRKIQKYYSNDSLIVTLMMDMHIGIGGTSHNNLQKQMDSVRDIRNNNKNRMLPFMAIDPRRHDALEIFSKAFDKNGEYQFFGLKVYPSLGYLPSHPNLIKMFDICQDKRIPVLAHCSSATVHSSSGKIKDIEGVTFNPDGSENYEPVSKRFRMPNKKQKFADFFNHPRNWEPVLEKYKKLNLCLAHFGGDDQWEKLVKGKTDNWVVRIIDLMYRYENVYADFAYTLYNHNYASRLKQMILDNQIIADRTLFGSDYFMVVTEGHFRNVLANFRTTMGDKIMHKIAKENAGRYLFFGE
ncbi:MAG: amidohydrolase family protein [Bacteroidota bacterium]|nr:amidohydrolase family protein [Bacteroidota bacterium]